MNDKEIFKKLISKDPSPGEKNRIIRKDNIYSVPGWVFDSKEDIVYIKYKKLNRELKKLGYNDQIAFDILVLGITKIEDRPKCPICGKQSRYENFTRGYQKTCGNKDCITQSIRTTVNLLWTDTDYKNTQINSHKEWCSKEENIQKMREYSLEFWKRDGYREKQSEVHKEFAKNNPDKMKSGNSGTQSSCKSMKGSLHYDSSWEQKFIVLCNNLDSIKYIERANISIPYVYLDDVFNYIPDFIITLSNNINILIEIKPNWVLKEEKTVAKIEAGRNYVDNTENISEYLILTEDILFEDGKNCKKFNDSGIINLINQYL